MNRIQYDAADVRKALAGSAAKAPQSTTDVATGLFLDVYPWIDWPW